MSGRAVSVRLSAGRGLQGAAGRPQDTIDTMTRHSFTLSPAVLAGLALFAGLVGCRRHPGPEQWDAYVQHFLDDYFRANPTFAAYQGKHEYDGKLPDWSGPGIAGEITRLHRE